VSRAPAAGKRGWTNILSPGTRPSPPRHTAAAPRLDPAAHSR
jgi:hypothetical protein